MDFPATEWTKVLHATLGDAAGRAALESLYERYLDPLKAFIRWQGSHDVDDAAQEFFLYLMESGVLHRADRNRGRFRTFLLTVLRRWLRDVRRGAAAQKRGGGTPALSIDDAPEIAGLEDEGAAAFDREWAVSVMEGALSRVAEEVRIQRGPEAWEVIKHFLGSGGDQPAGQTAAEMLGLTYGALRKEVHTWRRRLGECVRLEVARTVSTPHEVDEEIRYLRGLLTG
jgi:DNA-directed RNA polymerase specialized sigma24 family protein